jgi:hypothetical protein
MLRDLAARLGGGVRGVASAAVADSRNAAASAIDFIMRSSERGGLACLEAAGSRKKTRTARERCPIRARAVLKR